MIICRLAQWARQVHLRPSRDSRVALPTQNAGRRHASCGERAWTSTCPPPVSTMAGRLIDKLRLRSQKPGPVRAVRDILCLFVPVPSHAQHLAYSTSHFLYTTNVDSLAIHLLPLWLGIDPPLNRNSLIFPQTRRTIPSLPSLYRRRSSYETRD